MWLEMRETIVAASGYSQNRLKQIGLEHQEAGGSLAERITYDQGHSSLSPVFFWEWKDWSF